MCGGCFLVFPWPKSTAEITRFHLPIKNFSHSFNYFTYLDMASVNEGFVADEDVNLEKSQDLESRNSSASAKAREILGGDIDYSAARKAPLFIATIAGNH